MRVEPERGGVGVDRLRPAGLQPQQMAELQVGVRIGAVERQGAAIGGFRLDVIALFLQGVAELHPDRHQARFAFERLPVKGNGGRPVPRVAGAVGFLDQASVQALQLVGGIRHPGVEMRRLGIGLGRLVEPALQFHQMAELQVRVGGGGVERQGAAVGHLGAGILATFLHRMPELHP